jgi:hypothetical protein
MFYSCDLYTYVGFTMMISQLGFGDFGAFPKLGDQEAYFWHFDLKRNVTNI